MRELTIHERLNRIEDIIKNDPFKGDRALNNGNGGYIFDYDPEYEMIVRNHIKRMGQITGLGFGIKVIDLFDDILVPYLKKEDYLEAVIDLEEECRSSGNIDDLIHAMDGLLQQGDEGDLFVNYLCDNVEPNNVVFLLGVGKCHPFIRSHQIINNYDSMKHGVKTVLCYPGTYDHEQLKLFGTVQSENYYRASVLVPRRE